MPHAYAIQKISPALPGAIKSATTNVVEAAPSVRKPAGPADCRRYGEALAWSSRVCRRAEPRCVLVSAWPPDQGRRLRRGYGDGLRLQRAVSPALAISAAANKPRTQVAEARTALTRITVSPPHPWSSPRHDRCCQLCMDAYRSTRNTSLRKPTVDENAPTPSS